MGLYLEREMGNIYGSRMDFLLGGVECFVGRVIGRLVAFGVRFCRGG